MLRIASDSVQPNAVDHEQPLWLPPNVASHVGKYAREIAGEPIEKMKSTLRPETYTLLQPHRDPRS